MLSNKKIGFIGGGYMAEALVKGLLSSSLVASKDIFISDLISDRLEYLSKEYKVKTTGDNRELVQKVLESFSDLVDSNKTIISVAAGISIKLIEDTLDVERKKKISVIRTMPNMPALVQEGATAICGSEHSSKLDIEIAHHIFTAIGRIVDIEEIHMDAVTGLSGSGPAYIFMIIEALSDAGVKVGLSREVSNI